MLAQNLSEEARKAVNAAFDAISTWRTETLSNSEKKQRAGHRRNWLRLHGRWDGRRKSLLPPVSSSCVGGADQITGPDDCFVSNVGEAQLWGRRQLAKRRRFAKDSDEPLAALHAIH